ncbi:unnamed protein product [Urochloa humidicola]
MSKRQGPPKHQNRYAWKPHLNQKINETEPGGRFRPLSEITGVCQRCRDQIDWKRRDCSKNLGICAKCCTRHSDLVGRDVNEEDSERKALEEAIRGARERERRTLLRIMNKGKDGDSGPSVPKVADRSREGDIFPAASLDEYAEQAREQDDSDEEAGDFVED